MNLYDLTRGNYAVHRTVSYPDYPGTRLVFNTRVSRVSDREWSTTIEISGTYDAPADVIGVDDYQVAWTHDTTGLRETGSATLRLASGSRVRTTWVSTITMDQSGLGRFPDSGEVARVEYSPFAIEGNRMSYTWSGTVRRSPATVR